VNTVYVIGTCDTKQAELDYACERVRAAGASAVLIDISTGPTGGRADVSRETVAACHPKGGVQVLGQTERGQAIAEMGEALAQYLISRTDIGAVLGLGGSGNTSAVTAAMRALPVGVPKLMVSTLASGNIAPYVGPTDIAMMHAVADVAGLNAISRKVLANAAHAAAGMAINTAPDAASEKPGVGLTMFGVTTPCVTEVRRLIEGTHECFVFHATGTGGQCLEKLVDSGLLTSVIDITTTEVADHLFGGVLPCTDDRFGAMIRTRVPYVGSVGAVDMVNFGPRETVPVNFRDRLFHIHNPQVTLMRTTGPSGSSRRSISHLGRSSRSIFVWTVPAMARRLALSRSTTSASRRSIRPRPATLT
jgi:uncharacterized protein (UPF0261 family)